MMNVLLQSDLMFNVILKQQSSNQCVRVWFLLSYMSSNGLIYKDFVSVNMFMANNASCKMVCMSFVEIHIHDDIV